MPEASLILIIYLRDFGIGDMFDLLYVPFFIICSLDILQKIKWGRKILYRLGKKSTNMWLIHSFYCYYFYKIVKIVVSVRWAFLSLIILIVITYFSAEMVDTFWKIIGYIIEKIKWKNREIKKCI